MERIKLHFVRDLGSGWDNWPRAQRRNFAKRFLLGMVQDDFYHPKNPQDAGYLADLSWSALLTWADRVDQSKRIHTPTAPQTPTDQQWPATDWQAHYPSSPPHHAYPTYGNHFVPPVQDQQPPRSRR